MKMSFSEGCAVSPLKTEQHPAHQFDADSQAMGSHFWVLTPKRRPACAGRRAIAHLLSLYYF